MDVYQIVTDKIVAMLEAGVVPWRRPWTSAGLPRNLVTKKPYRGINHFLLSASKYVSPFWLTLKQANELGGSVRKGEQSTVIVFWKINQNEGETDDAGNEETQRCFLLRSFDRLTEYFRDIDFSRDRATRGAWLETRHRSSTSRPTSLSLQNRFQESDSLSSQPGLALRRLRNIKTRLIDVQLADKTGNKISFDEAIAMRPAAALKNEGTIIEEIRGG